MRREKKIEEVLPVWKVENNCLLSKQADLTLAFKISLPEIFTLTEVEYEALNQAWVKAIRVLPNHTILHKQDWFYESQYSADISDDEISFLAKSSERFFHERPFLSHDSYLFLTRKGNVGRRKKVSSLFTQPSIVPAVALNDKSFTLFMERVGQFVRILEASGFLRIQPLTEQEITGTADNAGILERYCFLLDPVEVPVIKDISFEKGVSVGDYNLQVFTLSDVEDMPGNCSPTRQYDKYSTEKTRFHIGFATPLTQLLNCNHIYNQYLVVEDAHETMKNLESKRLRLQSLSGYSRENTFSRDAVNDFLNEAILEQRLPVKAHFNIITWTSKEYEVKDIRNNVSAALAQMDIKTKQESIGSGQLFLAGIPGGAGYLPSFETFDTFCEQAVCFFSLETSYQTSLSPVGLRLGDRTSGKPLHVDISDEPVTRQICQNRAKFILGPSGGGRAIFN